MELSTSGDNRKRPGMEDKISDVNSQEPQQQQPAATSLNSQDSVVSKWSLDSEDDDTNPYLCERNTVTKTT
jgi:hypothetical protein